MAAVVTLVAGVVLERSGEAAAAHVRLSGVLFGATVLAAATSLPELSTGLTSVRARDFQLAVSDIFGGNAFLPVLFLLATLLSGNAILPDALVDADHRAWGRPNLFIADGSVMATEGAANPALTIMALSSRLAERLAGKRVAATTGRARGAVTARA